eukprot:TRINITY_DN1675_c0_g1_i2.p1 TRINITY_DN1675_c0_g1~~TRINITY_DN1675_c0_g1_i2.p1  ORF type:complete len:1027 (-),score=109.21 TRINITY_DN1675_c0_g1_i2:1051-4131(-)
MSSVSFSASGQVPRRPSTARTSISQRPPSPRLVHSDYTTTGRKASSESTAKSIASSDTSTSDGFKVPKLKLSEVNDKPTIKPGTHRQSISDVMKVGDVRKSVEMEMQKITARAHDAMTRGGHISPSEYDPFIAPHIGRKSPVHRSSISSSRLFLTDDRAQSPDTVNAKVKGPIAYQGGKKWGKVKISTNLIVGLEVSIRHAPKSAIARRRWRNLRDIVCRSLKFTSMKDDRPKRLSELRLGELEKIKEAFSRKQNNRLTILEFVLAIANVTLLRITDLTQTFQAINGDEKGTVSYEQFVSFLYSQYKSSIADLVNAKGRYVLHQPEDLSGMKHSAAVDRIIIAHELQSYITCCRDSSIRVWDMKRIGHQRDVIQPVDRQNLSVMSNAQMLQDIREIINAIPGAKDNSNDFQSHSGTTTDANSFRRPSSVLQIKSKGQESVPEAVAKALAKNVPLTTFIKPPPPPMTDSPEILKSYVEAVQAAAKTVIDTSRQSKKAIEDYMPSATRFQHQKKESSTRMNAGTWVLDMAYLPSQKKLFAAYSDKFIVIHSMEKKKGTTHIGSFIAPSFPSKLAIIERQRDEPCSTILAAGMDNGAIIFFDLDSNNIIGVRSYHTKSVSALHYASGLYLISSSNDGTVCLINPFTMELIGRLAEHHQAVTTLSHSSKLSLIAGGSFDGKLIFWNCYSQAVSGKIPAHNSPIIGVIFSDAHNTLISASADKEIKVWDIRTLQCLQLLQDRAIHTPRNKLSSISFDFINGNLLTAGSLCRIWSMQPLSKISQLSNTNGEGKSCIIGLHYSPTLKQMISISLDGFVRVWDVKKGDVTFEFLIGGEDVITATALDFGGSKLVTSHSDKSLKLWNFSSGQLCHSFDKSDCELLEIHCTPPLYQRPIIGLGSDKCLVSWMDPTTSKELNKPSYIFCHQAPIVCGTLLVNTFVSCDSDGWILIRNLEPSKLLFKFELPSGVAGEKLAVHRICYVKKRAVLVAATQLGTIYLVDPHRGKVVTTQPIAKMNHKVSGHFIVLFLACQL